MERRVRWVRQARDVMRAEPPADAADEREPSLLRVQRVALTLAWECAQSARCMKIQSRANAERFVKLWFQGHADELVCFAITVSYDGGRTWANPLSP